MKVGTIRCYLSKEMQLNTRLYFHLFCIKNDVIRLAWTATLLSLTANHLST